MLDAFAPRREGILQAVRRLEELRDERVARICGALFGSLSRLRLLVPPPALGDAYRTLTDRLERLAWRVQAVTNWSDAAMAVDLSGCCQRLADDIRRVDVAAYFPGEVRGAILTLRATARADLYLAQNLASLAEASAALSERALDEWGVSERVSEIRERAMLCRDYQFFPWDDDLWDPGWVPGEAGYGWLELS